MPAGLLIVALAFSVSSCRTSPGPVAPAFEPPPAQSVTSEPLIRIRIASDVNVVKLDSTGALLLGPPARYQTKAPLRPFSAPVTISRRDGAFVIRDGGGKVLSWRLPELIVQPQEAGRLISFDGQQYPHVMAVVPVVRKDGASTDRVDVVNHAPIESYLPGVLARELYASWKPQTFEAQAIAARSYALVEHARNAGRGHDVEATTASQAYIGSTNNPKAIAAVRATRGKVLIYEGRVLQAFYSSCAGGAGQDAAVAFPGVSDVPPLQGQRYGWGAQSPNYRWGPIQREVTSLALRIAAWGKANSEAVGQLQSIADIRISRVSRTGRPATFSIKDRQGRTFELPAERFRFACNFEGPGLAKLEASQVLKSSHVKVRMTGSYVQFYDGQGYGHGVGLCQWGAQDMAARGYDAMSILGQFYPGASVQQLYR
jgi:stage II sporulation protein D